MSRFGEIADKLTDLIKELGPIRQATALARQLQRATMQACLAARTRNRRHQTVRDSAPNMCAEEPFDVGKPRVGDVIDLAAQSRSRLGCTLGSAVAIH
jgi:hypothetical protein